MGRDGPVNILLVDDQPAKLLSYEVILADLGENLLKASSAKEALEQLLKNDVAVILVDVCMPELDGFELATMIREHPRFHDTAMIFVSAVQITDLDRLRGYKAGAVDYVPVPVIAEVLQAKVRVFVELYRKTRQLAQLNADLERRVWERTAALESTAVQLHRLNEELEQRIEQRTQERERAYAQLIEAQKMETIGQLTGGMAHDFNNLLMAVLGSLQLLRRQIPAESRAMRLLDNAVEGAQRGTALTQRLLAFARRQELKPEAVDVRQLVDSMEDLLKRALGPMINTAKELPSGLPHISVDANQLELALLNLAVNARDAMPVGGTFTISAALEVVTTEPASLRPGNYIRMRISDSGIGMDKATLAKATEPFFTTKGPGRGTGLGLSMVHGLAAQSGGLLVLSSVPGMGTTVNLWLPQAEAGAFPVARAPRAVLAERRLEQSYRILVVDDDLLVCTSTAAMLEDLGHKVVEAHSGREALDLLQLGDGVDMVLTDHAMPGMTGMDLIRQIQLRLPEMPVILASGFAELPSGDVGAKALCRLAKPFNQEELATALAEVSAASGAARPGPQRPLDSARVGGDAAR